MQTIIKTVVNPSIDERYNIEINTTKKICTVLIIAKTPSGILSTFEIAKRFIKLRGEFIVSFNWKNASPWIRMHKDFRDSIQCEFKTSNEFRNFIGSIIGTRHVSSDKQIGKICREIEATTGYPISHTLFNELKEVNNPV